MAVSSDEGEVSTDSLLLTGGEGFELVEREWRIEVVDGPDRELSIVRGSSETLVAGTEKTAHVRLSDTTVSRRHAELCLMPEGVLVIDLDSRNGTRVGKERINRAFIAPEGTVKLGHSTLRFTPIDRVRETRQVQHLGEFVTRTPRVERMLGLLERVAASASTVLIEGETGTGKELLAQAIHDCSPCADQSFVVVDCSAMVENLLESELFGHAKGAFTGATHDRIGAFEAADRGTVFLDELGELPVALQPKLLRALESRRVRRLGEVQDRPINVRIVAATNRDLAAMTKEGTFRSDLYYRVAVVCAKIPPLRERRDDIALLAERYVEKLSGGAHRLSLEAHVALAEHPWPGNARELRNVVERAIAVAPPGASITPDLLFGELAGVESREPATFREAKERTIAEFEKRYVEKLLERHGDNIARAAREAGISRNALYSIIKRVR